MIAATWNRAITAKARELAEAANLPGRLKNHTALSAIAALEIAAAAKITRRLTPDSTDARLAVPGLARPDIVAKCLLHDAAKAVSASVHSWRTDHAPFAGDRLKHFALHDLILQTVRDKLPDDTRKTLLRAAARASARLMDTLTTFAFDHTKALFARDAPAFLASREHLPPDRRTWLLAVEHNGSPSRARRVARRSQALALFAGLSSLLITPAFTRAIDSGKPLLPLVAAHFSLTLPQARALREAHVIQNPQPTSLQYVLAVKNLRAHEVPLHEWPGGGKPARPKAWHDSPWLDCANIPTLIRPDYSGADPQQTADAVAAFKQDLLDPLILSLATPTRYQSFLAALDLTPTSCDDGDYHSRLPATCLYLRAIHKALIGARKPNAFFESVQLWHRRAAAIAALRHERHSDRPGWPALCPPWTSACGAYTIVALTTAKALVDEGNAHQHCVGGYYHTCRQGDTQILSLRRHGQRAATVEVLLGPDPKHPSLRIGQFKGRYDCVPHEPAHHQALRDFLQAARAGLHPLNLRELDRYRTYAAEHYDHRATDTLPLEHARAAFPLYLALLPRGTPSSYDAWCESSGLKAALAEILQQLPGGA